MIIMINQSLPRYVIITGLLLLVGAIGVLFGLPIVAAPVILVLPGYSLTTAFFPGRDDVDDTERLFLVLGLNISLIPILALAVNALGFSLFGPGAPLFVALSLTIIFFTLISFWRKVKISRPAYDLPHLSKVNVLQIALALLLIAAVLIISAIPQDNPTEFYLLDDKCTLNHDLFGEAGEIKKVIVVVSNYCDHVSYTVDVQMDGKLLNKYQFTLHGEEDWIHEIEYEMPSQNAKLSFTLYENDVLIRRLHLLL